MNTLIELLPQIAAPMFTASLKATFVIVAILIIRAVLRKHLAARWLYALWLLVILRLLLPVDVPSPVSLHNLNPEIDKPAALVRPEQMVIAAVKDGEVDAASTAIISHASPSHQTVAAPSPRINAAPRFSGAEILGLIWLFGALVFLSLAAKSNHQLWRSMRGASPLKDNKIRRILEAGQRKLCITKKDRYLQRARD